MWNNTSLGADEESHKDGTPPKFLFGVHLEFHYFQSLPEFHKESTFILATVQAKLKLSAFTIDQLV